MTMKWNSLKQFELTLASTTSFGDRVVDLSDTAIGSIIDDELRTVTVTSTQVSETDGFANLLVFLDRPFEFDLDIELAFHHVSTNDDDFDVSPKSVRFAARSTTPKMVPIEIFDDVTVESIERFDLSLRPTTDTGLHQIALSTESFVEITSNDAAGVELSKSNVRLSESSSAENFNVRLSAQPESNVEIAIFPEDISEISLSRHGLFFSPANWDVAQEIQIIPVDERLVDGPQTTNAVVRVIDHLSDGHFSEVPDEMVTVVVDDNDSAGFAVIESDGSTVVSESGTTDSFDLVLTAQPESPVILNVTDSEEVGITADTLTFSTDDWNVPQTVIVTGLDDDFVDGNQTVNIFTSILIAESDAAFADVNRQSVSATNQDDDIAGFVISESNGSTSVDESGTMDDFNIILASQPLTQVVLLVAGSPDTTVSAGSVTFTTGNWNQPQFVTVTGVDDDFVDGTTESEIQVRVYPPASDDMFGEVEPQELTVQNVDDDIPGFSVATPKDGLIVTESGAFDEFEVSLDAAPLTAVVLQVQGTAEVAVSPMELTFTPGNWNATQSITLTGRDDNLVDGEQKTDITISVVQERSDRFFHPIPNELVEVVNIDDDIAGFSISEDTRIVVEESQTSESISVRLNAQPLEEVVLSASESSELVLTPSYLTFTFDNWDITQHVSVSAFDDDYFDGDQVTLVKIDVVPGQSDRAFADAPPHSIEVQSIDNDTAGIKIVESDGVSEFSENGLSDSISVRLTSRPQMPVVLTATSDDLSELLLDKELLTFTPDDWDIAQTLILSPVDDKLIDGAQTVTITVSVVPELSDESFSGALERTLEANVADDDIAGFTVTQSSETTTVTENGETDEISIFLNAQPTTPVVITIEATDEAVANPSTITFTNTNWNEPFPVVVSGIDDDFIDGDQLTHLTIGVLQVQSDADFSGVRDYAIPVVNLDNDRAGISVTESGDATIVDELNSTDDVTVVLASQPMSDVVLQIVYPDSLNTSVDVISFSSENWNIPQSFTISGNQNNFVDGDRSVSVLLSVIPDLSDPDYSSADSQSISIFIVDDDQAGFTVHTTETTIAESSQTSMTVSLTAQPKDNVVLTVQSDDPGEVYGNPGQLTFSPASWAVPQTVVLHGVDDSERDGDQESTVRVSVKTSFF